LSVSTNIDRAMAVQRQTNWMEGLECELRWDPSSLWIFILLQQYELFEGEDKILAGMCLRMESPIFSTQQLAAGSERVSQAGQGRQTLTVHTVYTVHTLHAAVFLRQKKQNPILPE